MLKKLLTKIRYYSLICIPSLTVLLSIFLYSVPYPIDNSSVLMPSIVLAVIYYWSLYYPHLLPYICLLLLGLLQDIITVNSLGLNALMFIIFRLLIRSQRKYLMNKTFIMVWAGFMFCLGAILILPFLLNIYNYPIPILFSQWLISIFIYVPIHWLLSKLRLKP
jgi:rod shape-determining protein MreD